MFATVSLLFVLGRRQFALGGIKWRRLQTAIAMSKKPQYFNNSENRTYTGKYNVARVVWEA